VAEGLANGGFVHRYLGDAPDGLPPGEGVFLMCTFWLADCWAHMGQLQKAQETVDRLLTYANDVGLYAEELDPATGEFLGNFPQAFSHVALINAVITLQKAESETAGGEKKTMQT
jgi:GH15 family glucan-1,4-alpha-glucosidase